MVYAFFNAGAEISLGILKKRPFSVLLFGALTFFIPFITGSVFAISSSDAASVQRLSSEPFSLLRAPAHPASLRADLSTREPAEIGMAGSALSRIAVTLILFFSVFVQDRSLLLPSLGTVGLWLFYFVVLGLALLVSPPSCCGV
jgi:hypothetical protein